MGIAMILSRKNVLGVQHPSDFEACTTVLNCVLN